MGCSESKDVPGHNVPGNAPRDQTENQKTEQAQANGDKPLEATSSKKSSPTSEFTDFAQEALLEHNHYRKTHQAEPLVLSKDLCQMADRLCRHLVEAKTFCNSGPDQRLYKGEECGENLYRHWGGPKDEMTAGMVCQSWYDEVDNYHHDMMGFDLASCHFTQVVWKETKEFGIAYGHYDDDDGFRKFIVVANYFPSGNIEGAYVQNITIPDGFFDPSPRV